MSHTLRFTLRTLYLPLKHDFFKLSPIFSNQATRFLYAQATLGLDAFTNQKQQVKHQMGNIETKFRERMNTYATEDSKNMIFTEDLKNMVHLAENDSDFELVIRMAKKFNQQNKSLRFGNFVFGPVIMRMFYLYKKPDLAIECFKSPELDGLFDQLMTYQILLDLLYESEKYQEILDIFEIIVSKQLQGAKYPRNSVVLAMAACYKLNSKDSMKFAFKLWNDLAETGHFPMRRATTFCAGLALNQGKPDVALEVLSAVRKPNYVTIRNLKVQALSDLGRVEEALALLKTVLSDDQPGEVVQTYNKDVINSVKAAVKKLDNAELSTEFEKIEQLLEKEGHVTDDTLDRQLCSEIQQPPIMNNRQTNRFSRYGSDEFRTGKNFQRNNRPIRRPGLQDMV